MMVVVGSRALVWQARVGTDARDRGVGISLISVRGAEIQLATVGQVATLTGGSISIADASALADALRSVASPTVGARAQITVRAPNGVSFYSPTTGRLGAKIATADLGSAFVATDFVVGFELDVGFAEPSVRFQIELEWTNSQGQRLLRIETVDAPVSDDRNALERRCNMALPALAAIRRSAALAAARHALEAGAARVRALHQAGRAPGWLHARARAAGRDGVCVCLQEAHQRQHGGEEGRLRGAQRASRARHDTARLGDLIACAK